MGITPEHILGQTLQLLREQKGITRLELGREINQTDQQITKFEKGETLIPLSVLEEMAEALGEALPKRIIRRISFLRKLAQETGEAQPDLEALYRTLFNEE